jgi:hypothetical protein
MRPTPLSDGPGNSEAGEVPEFDFTTSAYAAYCKSLDAQLTLLIEAWQHLAAPRALRIDRMVSRPRNSSTT